MRAAAIVMALPRRIAGASLFGKTLETVLPSGPAAWSSSPAPTARAAVAGAHMGVLEE